MRGDFCQPDGRFHGFHLAEERADTAEIVMAPVLQKSRRLWSHLPGARWELPPLIYMQAEIIDEGGMVFLFLGGNAVLVGKVEFLLFGATLLGLRDWSDEIRAAAFLEDLLRRLPVCVQFPVSTGILVR